MTSSENFHEEFHHLSTTVYKALTLLETLVLKRDDQSILLSSLSGQMNVQGDRLRHIETDLHAMKTQTSGGEVSETAGSLTSPEAVRRVVREELQSALRMESLRKDFESSGKKMAEEVQCQIIEEIQSSITYKSDQQAAMMDKLENTIKTVLTQVQNDVNDLKTTLKNPEKIMFDEQNTNGINEKVAEIQETNKAIDEKVFKLSTNVDHVICRLNEEMEMNQAEISQKLMMLIDNQTKMESDISGKMKTLGVSHSTRPELDINGILKTLVDSQTRMESDINKTLESLTFGLTKIESDLKTFAEIQTRKESDSQTTRVEPDIDLIFKTLVDIVTRMESDMSGKLKTLADSQSRMATGLNGKLQALTESQIRFGSDVDGKLWNLTESQSRMETGMNGKLQALTESQIRFGSDVDGKMKNLTESQSRMETGINGKLQALADSQTRFGSDIDGKLRNLTDSQSRMEIGMNGKLQALADSQTRFGSDVDVRLRTMYDSNFRMEPEILSSKKKEPETKQSASTETERKTTKYKTKDQFGHMNDYYNYVCDTVKVGDRVKFVGYDGCRGLRRGDTGKVVTVANGVVKEAGWRWRWVTVDWRGAAGRVNVWSEDIEVMDE